MLSSWKFSVTWWTKWIAHCLLLFNIGKKNIFFIVLAVCLALVQHSNWVEFKIKNITFSGLRDQRVLSSAVLEQLSSQSMAVELGGWCRHVGVGNFLHCHLMPKLDGWTLTQHPVCHPFVLLTSDLFTAWTLLSHISSHIPHGDRNSPKSSTRCQKIGWFARFEQRMGKIFYLVWNFFKGLTLLILHKD